ncbi:hypothetical protein [Gemmata sp.]|uniref:hypothetical protein n=1 Tax=Gemmata sp. TaxID=1914242 RepID=UPI003F6E9628
MSRRVSVHHFVANLTTRQYGSHPTSDLLGVDYWHDVPADAEFPRTIGRLDLFTRFYLDRARPVEFMVQIRWNDHPSGTPVLVGSYGPFRVAFPSTASVRDVAFRLHMVRVQGAGRHSIELFRERTRGWQAGELVSVARTDFYVER